MWICGYVLRENVERVNSGKRKWDKTKRKNSLLPVAVLPPSKQKIKGNRAKA